MHDWKPPQFQADFSIRWNIGEGFFHEREDNQGWVTITDGRLKLYRYHGEVIAEAPVSEVRADVASHGRAVELRIGKETYRLGPVRAHASLADLFIPAASPITTSRQAKLTTEAKGDVAGFIEVLEGAGAQVGEPRPK